MPAQEEYYNQFGAKYKADILACAEPHLWTTDRHANGKVYNEMKKRIGNQELFIDKYFDNKFPVLDIGCGFGRQAYLLAQKGFIISGIDTSEIFIDIAKDLFRKHNYSSEFSCVDLMKTRLEKSYRNILLFDVLEHIIPFRRRKFMKNVHEVTQPGGVVIMSLPHEVSAVTIRKIVKQYIPYYVKQEEHPFVIPQKKDVERIVKNYFDVLDFLPTDETDYYILKRP
jgi:2-polyprenyl-3-methyl-5-hydroxy-6-metoxy-1,4-benzoquinol methylase